MVIAWCEAEVQRPASRSRQRSLALRDRPEMADAVSARLEEELERHLSRQGKAHSTGRGT
jgi:hypothetical protein